ncbi:MAG TPA: TIGR02301 family protein [Roseiarcus sp.]|nr:TIGR02301 family protein [Roseiarcus sp.]
MSPVVAALALALAAVAAKPAPTPSPTRVAPPPYEADLLRLSELMGALAYLRDLCHDGDGAEFRRRIAGLIDADPRPQEEKDQLAGAFNRGFGGYRLTYRTCTSNARTTIAAYLTESERLAKAVAARYGGR